MKFVIKKRKFGVVFFRTFLVLVVTSIIVFLAYPHFARNYLFPKKYSECISKYSQKYGVDEYFVYSIIYNESRFNEYAQSNAGAKGLMQITENTFNWAKSRLDSDDYYEYKDIFDYEVNIKYGTYILSTLRKEFKTDKEVAAAYHSGRGKVNEWLSDGNNRPLDEYLKENRNKYPAAYDYINKVDEVKKIYKKLYSEV